MKYKYVDLLLYSEEKILDIKTLLSKHYNSLGYLNYLPGDFEIKLIQHAGFNIKTKRDKINIEIIKANNNKWALYLKLFLAVKKNPPDVLLLHSFIYAWQIIVFRIIVGNKVKLIVQNHAERPYKGVRQLLQKYADKFISAYLFVSKEQANSWIEKGIIKNRNKVFEVMEGSTSFMVKNKEGAKKNLGYSYKTLFIWVGRLDSNKDPLTVLKAFAVYVKQNTNAKLMMVYGTCDLEVLVKTFIEQNHLSSHVDVFGKLEHHLLEDYYNAADYFILGSHYEGSGYALCEAMACGCIPIVTNIPSFKSMTNNGDCGFLFSPGNHLELLQILNNLKPEEIEFYKTKVLDKFKNDLSFEAIANRISEIVKQLD